PPFRTRLRRDRARERLDLLSQRLRVSAKMRRLGQRPCALGFPLAQEPFGGPESQLPGEKEIPRIAGGNVFDVSGLSDSADIGAKYDFQRMGHERGLLKRRCTATARCCARA